MAAEHSGQAGRRASAGLGVQFDTYWLSGGEMRRRVVDAGFTPVFGGSRPAGDGELCPRGHLPARR